MKRLGDNSEYFAVCDTLQFEAYSKFAAGTFNEAHKRKVREEQFSKDLQAAYDIGFPRADVLTGISSKGGAKKPSDTVKTFIDTISKVTAVCTRG